MIRCKDCKWWLKSTDKSDKGYGFCNSGFISYGDPGLDDTQLKEEETNYLFYMDYEAYKATCYTGPDFGCVHGEVKEDYEGRMPV